MSNKISNYPNAQIDNLPSEDKQEIVTCLLDLAKNGKPQTLDELKQRFADYFSFCQSRGFRCGIESLCLSLGVSRVTFWNWCRGENCDKEWTEQCQQAKQVVIAFIEQASLSGKLNPATSIFVLKNWGNYKDAISFEESTPRNEKPHIKTLADIRREHLEMQQNAGNDGTPKETESERFKMFETE